MTRLPPFAQAPEPEPREFERFAASELFCPRCRAAMPVRERLLLVLPDGELFEYRCEHCGESLGKRKAESTQVPTLLVPR